MAQRTVEFRRGSKVEPVQIIVPNTPEINRQAGYVEDCRQRLVLAEKSLKEIVEVFQQSCEHDFQKIMRFDENYCGRVDGRGIGQDVYIGKRCKKCGLFESRPAGRPWEICHKCGGIMKWHDADRCGEDRVNINKCQSCGHEYNTT